MKPRLGRLAWISWASSGISCRSPTCSTAFRPSGNPASASSCLGRLDVLRRAAAPTSSKNGYERGDHVVVADVGLALEQRVDHRLAVERAHAERLADPLVGELPGVAAHPDLAVGGGLDLERR